MFLFWNISHQVVMMFVLIVSGLFFSLSYLNTTFHQPQYSFYWYFLFCLCISLTSIVRLINPGWISSSSSVRRERSSKCNIWPCGGQYWTHFTRPWNNLLCILPYFYKPSYTLCPCAYYVSNLFLVVGEHDHVAHPVLEGHSPEVQHCVLFWTLNNEDFEGIQLRKKCDCVLFWTLNNVDFEGIRFEKKCDDNKNFLLLTCVTITLPTPSRSSTYEALT